MRLDKTWKSERASSVQHSNDKSGNEIATFAVAAQTDQQQPRPYPMDYPWVSMRGQIISGLGETHDWMMSPEMDIDEQLAILKPEEGQ